MHLKKRLEIMSKEELIGLVLAYDSYIQNANDDDRYANGFLPVSVAEYIDNELFEITKEECHL